MGVMDDMNSMAQQVIGFAEDNYEVCIAGTVIVICFVIWKIWF